MELIKCHECAAYQAQIEFDNQRLEHLANEFNRLNDLGHSHIVGWIDMALRQTEALAEVLRDLRVEHVAAAHPEVKPSARGAGR